MYIFTHIPKTGGTTFDKSIIHNFKYSFSAHDGIEKYSLKFGSFYDFVRKKNVVDISPDYIHSHLPYGIHEIFSGKNHKYITFLREPHSRVISSIRHIHKFLNKSSLLGDDDTFPRLRSKCRKDNKKLLEQLLKHNINCNHMTLQLSGCVDLENIYLSQDLKNTGLFFSPYFRLKEAYSDSEMESFLNSAINNLSEYYFIGLQEKFSKSLKAFANKSNMTIKRVERKQKKTSKNLFRISLKDKDVLDILAEMNKYDTLLYNYIINKE